MPSTGHAGRTLYRGNCEPRRASPASGIHSAPDQPGAQAARACLCPIHRRLWNGRSHRSKVSPRLTSLGALRSPS